MVCEYRLVVSIDRVSLKGRFYTFKQTEDKKRKSGKTCVCVCVSVVNGVVVSTSVVGNSSGGTGLGGSGVSTGPSAAVAQILSQAAARADSRAITSPPQENFDLSRGPQTPTEDPDNSYDPCDPTESPELDNGHDDGLLDDDDDDDDGGVFNGLLTKEQNGNKKSMGGVNSNGLSNNRYAH